MQIREIQDDQGFAALEPAWRDLHTRSASRNVYLAHEFLFSWWRHLGALRGGAADRPGGLGRDSQAEGLRILVGLDGDRVVGIAPLQLLRTTVDGLEPPLRVLTFLGDVFITRYRDFLMEPQRAADFTAALWTHLCGAASTEWDAVLLGCFHEESTTGQLCNDALGRLSVAGLRQVRFRTVTAGGATDSNLHEVRQDLRLAAVARATAPAQRAELQALLETTDDGLPAALESAAAADAVLVPMLARGRRLLKSPFQDLEYPFVALPPSWDEYRARLSSNTRSSLRSISAAKLGVVAFEVVDENFDAGAHLDDLLRLHRASVGADSLTLNPRTVAAQAAMFEGCARRGWLRFVFLTVNGQRVAALVSYDFGGRRYPALIGRDPAAAGSPGLAIIGHSLEDAIARGLEEFDFGPGHVRYKERFTRDLRRATNLLVKKDTVALGLRELAPRLTMFG